MRSLAAWADHPQGRAVAAEPLVLLDKREAFGAADGPIDPARPLAGVRVLDLTRILAGPVAPASSPPTAPTYCASTRPTGTSRASRPR